MYLTSTHPLMKKIHKRIQKGNLMNSNQLIDEEKYSPRPTIHKKLFIKLISQLNNGLIELRENGEILQFGDNRSDIRAQITIINPKAYKKIIWGGSIGAAEAYVEGLWSTDNLTEVIQVFSRNLSRFEKYEKNYGFIINFWHRLHHLLNKNSKSKSRTNIASHYDLSNDMYKLFLDPHMQYSSAIFTSKTNTLEQAQENKLKTICESLALTEKDHLLEIGTGWGGLACYAAKHYGCKVTTTTISKAQYEIALERIKHENLEQSINLLCEDYRDLSGEYNKIVSIEMIEAVGHQFIPEYFRKLDSLLTPGGQLLIQGITINDQRYDAYRKSVDFIQRYIFPGGHLPSVNYITEQVKDNTSMYLTHYNDFRQDYAKTLDIWRERFLTQKNKIISYGFNQDFIRLWEFYFCYCSGAFKESVIGVAHFQWTKSKH